MDIKKTSVLSGKSRKNTSFTLTTEERITILANAIIDRIMEQKQYAIKDANDNYHE